MGNALFKKRTIISLFIVAIIALFLASPKLNMDALFAGVQVWATNILPALFPFLFFTKILNELGMVEQVSKLLAPVMKKLFNTPGISAYIYLMSILSGYPVGAKITSDLYTSGHLTYGQACRTTTFTSTSGPLFIIGTVGIGMFHSQTMGAIILVCHLLSALINGLIYRKYNLKTEVVALENLPNNEKSNLLENAMLSSIKSITIIGGYIAIFFMLITMFQHYNILAPVNFVFENILRFLKVPTDIAQSLTNGLVEVTKGCLTLAESANNFKLNTIFATGIITFGGFSVHLQAYTFLKKFNIKFSFYMLQKLTHTIIAILLCIAYFIVF